MRRTSAIDGGNMRRHQDSTANKKIARFAITMASQTRWVFSFHMVADGLGIRPQSTPVLVGGQHCLIKNRSEMRIESVSDGELQIRARDFNDDVTSIFF
jgi:hypothetical protein